MSVLLPVHNGADYIESALRSMMSQTLRDIEILAIDDVSTDETPAILARLAAEDDRIRVLRPERNLRLAAALNFGLDHVRGTYVARMDADDLSEPNRLEVQVHYFEAHPDIALIGCSDIDIDPTGRVLKANHRPLTPFCMRWTLRLFMPFRHPTMMFRRDQVTLRYDPAFTVAQDHDFMRRLTETHNTACLPDLLLRYRKHSESITGKNWRQSLLTARKAATEVQRSDLPRQVFEDLEPFRDAFFSLEPLTETARATMFRGLRGMIEADRKTAPEHAAWVVRQTARFAETALRRSGDSRRTRLETFLRHGRFLLLPGGLRYLESRQSLPRFLDSQPVV